LSVGHLVTFCNLIFGPFDAVAFRALTGSFTAKPVGMLRDVDAPMLESPMEPFVIVGAGQAGAQAAQSLRQLGYNGDLVVLGDEGFAPYQRPPLSKKYLAGDMSAEHLLLRPPAFWEKERVDIRPGVHVQSIDVVAKRIQIAGGSLGYAKLLLATGTRARPLHIEGAALVGVLSLRTIADVDRLRPVVARGGRIVIIGGGYIGLEVAAVARSLGLDVTILEATARILGRVVSPEVSAFFTDLHQGHGVRIRTATPIARLEGRDGHVTGVTLGSGETIPADLVLVAIGALPNDTIAAAASIHCQDGIVVDATTRCNAPDIFAAGDCTRFPSALYGRSIRLESVQNAVDQAKAAATAMLGGSVQYDPVPWFWSDQFDIKLQIAGLSQDHDRVIVDGNPADRTFSVAYIRNDTLLAVDAINRPRDHMLARRGVGKPYTPPSS
jgi:3-phenylpropionate/trans-cinnamate dioxygenase ferredoxin reductase subunit